jgi:rubredoxin
MSLDDLEAPPVGSETSEPLVVDPRTLDCYECGACGYSYEPVKGDSAGKIAAGTDFKDLPQAWRCPVCGARQDRFSNIGPVGNPSGFKENLGYGLGVNTMTPGQKNILIFGALGVFFLLFLSLYGLK